MAIDAERIGQRQRYLASGSMGDLGRLHEGLLGLVLVEQIPFQIGDRGVADGLGVDIVRSQLDADPEEGLHCALGVRGHENQTARRRRSVRHRAQPVIDASGADVVAEHLAKLVVAHLADIGAVSTQRRDSGQRVRGRAARRFDARPHLFVKLARAVGIDQRHRAFFEPERIELPVFGLCDHIDDGVSDANDVEGRFGHGCFLRIGAPRQYTHARDLAKTRSWRTKRISPLAPTPRAR